MILNVKNTTTGNVSIFNFTTFGDMMQHVRLFANKPHFDANVIIDGKVTHRGAAEILNLNNWF